MVVLRRVYIVICVTIFVEVRSGDVEVCYGRGEDGGVI